MKIELDTQPGDINIIQSYSTKGIVINQNLYQNSIIVSPEQLIPDWQPQSAAELSFEHFNEIFGLAPEVLLIGTGKTLHFPAHDLLTAIMSENVGVEVMDTRAACRAYNLIAGEGRIVVAALLGIET